MSWRNIKLIFRREVLDQLRDRRTLFMIAVLPLLLYPALGIGTVYLQTMYLEHPRTVVILGADDLPPPQLLSGDHFAATWFTIPDNSDRLLVVTDSSAGSQEPATEADKAARQSRARLLEQARELRPAVKQYQALERQIEQARHDGDEAAAHRLAQEREQVKATLSDLFSRSQIQVLILVPEGFAHNIERLREELSQRRDIESLRANFDYARPLIVQNSADDKSLIAYSRIREVMQSWEQEILRQQLKESGLPENLPTPVHAEPVDVARDEQRSKSVWSKLFPALLVIMAVTGAFYPAVDLAAGEKERGTMETLLICPASRTEIVMGKFFTVMLFSFSTALLNLVSMGITGKYIFSLAGGAAASKLAGLALPSPLSLTWVIVFLIPLAALFSALCLALATFARSSKEGQYYLMPLVMVTMGLTVFCLSPGVEIDAFYSILPVMGPALLLKGLLLSTGDTHTLYLYMIPVLTTSIGYSLLALWWAIDLFASEDVLFREAERFELKAWIRHLLRDKEPTPSFAEAGFCFVLIMLLQFGALKFMQQPLQGVAREARGLEMMKLLIIQQLVIIATPALLMGVMLTTSFRRTFRLNWPRWSMLATAAVLPLVLHPLSIELAVNLQWFFPKLPKSFEEVLQSLSSHDLPLWLVVLAFAIAPAMCEEIGFRGFILSGFSRSGRTWLAIVLSSLTFGIMHMVPQQVFNASLLGLVLGLIAVRSNSLLPCILFHALYNSLEIVRARVSAAGVSLEGPAGWFAWLDPTGIRYTPLTLTICGLAAIGLLRWLVNQRPEGLRPLAEPEPLAANAPIHARPI